jgi:signal recognition particle subunit SRP19
MKDYDRLVIWIDYFNSGFSREEGRKVPLNMAVRNPTLNELEEAAKKAGYKPETKEAAYPRRMQINSGYISIERNKPKIQVIKELASRLSMIRGEQRLESKKQRN